MQGQEINLADASAFSPEFLFKAEEKKLPKPVQNKFDLELRPITKGLGIDQKRGFQKGSKTFVKSSLNQGTAGKTQTNLKRAEYLKPFYEDASEEELIPNIKTKLDQRVDISKEIPLSKKPSKNLEHRETQPQIIGQASFLQRLGAWLIDFTVVMSSFLLLVGIFSYASGTTPREMLATLIQLDFLPITVFQIFFFYLSYFTLMDLSSGTLGKELLGLRLESYDGEKISFKILRFGPLFHFFRPLLFSFPVLLICKEDFRIRRLLKDSGFFKRAN